MAEIIDGDKHHLVWHDEKGTARLRLKKLQSLLAELNYPEPVETEKQSPHTTYMNQAFEASYRSPDAQTKHGCVIVSADGHLLSTGYNGFPRNIDYSLLPNTRPHKYAWMRHAERNALAWCETRPINATAYVTGESCNECLMTMWQHGITRVFQAERHGSALISEEDRKVREVFLHLSHMAVIKLDVTELLKNYN